MWAVLAALSIVYFVRHMTKAWTGIALHMAFVIILVGAFVTHVSSQRGQIHLRKGVFSNQYTIVDKDNKYHEATLPFEIRLDSFEVKYHAGTDAAQDYVSIFTINDDGKSVKGKVSMNKISVMVLCDYTRRLTTTTCLEHRYQPIQTQLAFR